MKRILLTLGFALPVLIFSGIHVMKEVEASNDTDIASLKETHDKYLKAWSDADVETIVEIATGSVGFGHSTAFPRPIRIENEFRNNVIEYYKMMEKFQINTINTNHLVRGNTGLAWGHYSQTTKQKDGPTHTVYLRFAHTFVKENGKWKLVMYHRSKIPTDETQ